MDPKIGLVIAAAFVAGFLFFSTRGAGNVSGGEARRLVTAGARLVDVRTPAEFAAGHLPGAVNVPVQELGARMGEIGPKEADVVVYCRSGARSGAAKRMLEGAGFKAVHDLGGMGRW